MVLFLNEGREMKKMMASLLLGCSALASAAQVSGGGDGLADASSGSEAGCQGNQRFMDEGLIDLNFLRNELDSTFAGTWVECDANHKIHQVTAVTRATEKSASLASASNQVVHVKRSLEELEAIQSQVVGHFMSGLNKPFFNEVVAVSLDVMSNQVDVRTNESSLQTLRKSFIALGIDMDGVNFSTR